MKVVLKAELCRTGGVDYGSADCRIVSFFIFFRFLNSLSHNLIGDEGAKAIGQMLGINFHLQTLKYGSGFLLCFVSIAMYKYIMGRIKAYPK